MRDYIANIRCVLSHTKWACRHYGFLGFAYQMKGLLFVALNWRNGNISNWHPPYTATAVWMSEQYAAYEMDGSPYPAWTEIVVDQRWWVPGFNEERVC